MVCVNAGTFLANRIALMSFHHRGKIRYPWYDDRPRVGPRSVLS
jgi:hypothetical protein